MSYPSLKRPSISVAVICKNEANNIRQWYKSLEGLFDDYVFVDTGSTDGTIEIAKELGLKVHHFEWINDFSAARNFAFSQVKTDYAFWNDLDDVLEGREAFAHFRDHVMGLADYWVAAYHYASDQNGKPVVSFARERVLNMAKGMRWQYPIHEGVVPTTSLSPVRTQYCPTWSIRHMRTAEDLAKDRMRNLHIFEDIKKKGNLEPRLKYYYGKELFETGKPIEAIVEFSDILTKPDLEIHDRILGHQFMCYAYMQCNQFEQAIGLAHAGLQLAPNRAEFHAIIADCYIKMGRLPDSVPFLKAAAGCTTFTSQMMTQPIFHNQDAYTVYPRNQLSKVYANLGDLELAEREAVSAHQNYSHPESAQIVQEIDRMKTQAEGHKTAKECSDIVISCPPQGAYLWDPDVAKVKSMGGSETAAIEMAYWLRRLSGRTVKIFNPREDRKTIDGVDYLPVSDAVEYFAKNKPYLHIAWRHNMKLTNAPTFLWSHDLNTPFAENHVNYDKLLCLTPFHKRYVMGTQGVPEDKIHVTRNGIKPGRFKDGPWEKDPLRFVFPNSPDRGLDRAIRVLDRVRNKYPVTLHIHYGYEHLHKYGLQGLADLLRGMIAERPWITYHGATQQDLLMESFKKSAYWVSPSDWIETSQISSMELICCGVYPIFRGIGGAVDTMYPYVSKGMGTMIEGPAESERDLDKYVEACCRAIEDQAYLRVKSDPDAISWEKVAQEWLRDLPAIAYPLEKAV